MKDAHTTIAGLAAGLGLLGAALAEILKDGWQPEDMGLLIAAFGTAMAAYLAADSKPAEEGEGDEDAE